MFTRGYSIHQPPKTEQGNMWDTSGWQFGALQKFLRIPWDVHTILKRIMRSATSNSHCWISRIQRWINNKYWNQLTKNALYSVQWGVSASVPTLSSDLGKDVYSRSTLQLWSQYRGPTWNQFLRKKKIHFNLHFPFFEPLPVPKTAAKPSKVRLPSPRLVSDLLEQE